MVPDCRLSGCLGAEQAGRVVLCCRFSGCPGLCSAMTSIPRRRNGRECLSRYPAAGALLARRVLLLVTMAVAQAATGDPDLRSFADTIESERAAGTAATARHVADRFGLRDGLDVSAAQDVLWALTAPDLADRLVNRREWGWDRFQAWLGNAMGDAPLGPSGAEVGNEKTTGIGCDDANVRNA